MKNFDYLEPVGKDEALTLLSNYGKRARIIAGGTDLVPQLKRGLFEVDALISLRKIPELRHVRIEKGAIEIGSMITLRELELNPYLGSNYIAFRDALTQVAAPPIRNSATLGGNVCLDTKCIYRDQVRTWERNLPPCFKLGGRICHFEKEGTQCHASFAADTVPVLISYGAKARVFSSAGERILPIEDLYTGNGIRPINLRDEILGGVSLPLPGLRTGAAYKRYSLRKAIDFQDGSVAVCLRMDGDVCSFLRIILGGVAPGPVRLVEIEKSVEGENLSDDLLRQLAFESPGAVLKATRRGRIDETMGRLVSGLLYDCLRQAWSRAKESTPSGDAE